VKGGNDCLDVESGRWKNRESLTDTEMKDFSHNSSEESILRDDPTPKNQITPLKINVSTVYAIAEDSPRTADLRGTYSVSDGAGQGEKTPGIVPRNPFLDPAGR